MSATRAVTGLSSCSRSTVAARACRRRSLGNADLDPRVADDEHVAGREPGRLLDALSVHPGAVQRAQVLDLDALLNGPNSGVPPRDLRVVEEQIGALAPDDELGRGLEA